MSYMLIFSYGDGVHLRVAKDLETAEKFMSVENQYFQRDNIDTTNNIVMYKQIKSK